MLSFPFLSSPLLDSKEAKESKSNPKKKKREKEEEEEVVRVCFKKSNSIEISSNTLLSDQITIGLALNLTLRMRMIDG